MNLAIRLFLISVLAYGCDSGGAGDSSGTGGTRTPTADTIAQLSVELSSPVAEVDERYLSVAVDTAQVDEGAVLGDVLDDAVHIVALGQAADNLGTLLGALFLGIVKNALPVVDISPFWQLAISGTAIIVAVAFNSRSARSKGRIILKRAEGHA